MREWKKAFQNFNEILEKNLLTKGKFEENKQIFLKLSKDSYQTNVDKSILEQNYCEVYKNLSLWDNLKIVAENTNNIELNMEIAWRQKDFSKLNQVLSTPYFESSSFYYLCQVIIFLNDLFN